MAGTAMLPDIWPTVRAWAAGVTIGAAILIANARVIYEYLFDITMLVIIWWTG